MIFNMSGGGGGGAALNFSVAGNPQPASPAENTIWVNTDVKITGWEFSATQPEAATEGAVWISTGEKSNVAFNALKQNCILVCPIKAKQYTGGVWVDREAKSYIGGVWVDWYRCEYVFQNGEFANGALDYMLAYGSCSVKVDTDGAIYMLAAYPNATIAYTTVKFDVTEWNKIIFVLREEGVYAGSPNGVLTYGVSSTQRDTNYAASNTHSIGTSTSDTELSVDISGLTGEYYWKFSCNSSGSGSNIVRISEIRFE